MTSWNPNANSNVAVILPSGGLVYVGGDFTTIGGQTRNRIVALDATSGLATSWNPNANATVIFEISITDGVVYAVGILTSIFQIQPVSGIAFIPE